MSRLFVLSHEAAVAVDVGAEYGGELALQSSPRFILPFVGNVCQIARNGLDGKLPYFETREVVCRMMPPLTHKLAEARALWKGTSPVTERIAEESFLSTRDSKKRQACQRRRRTRAESSIGGSRSRGRLRT